MSSFVRKPQIYEVLTLPSKLPPLKQASPVTSLPMLGYMEQAVATAIIESLSAAGTFKPKFPFFSSTKSALYYVGLYLKGMLWFCYKYALPLMPHQCYDHHNQNYWFQVLLLLAGLP